jgi:hypothetical protein
LPVALAGVDSAFGVVDTLAQRAQDDLALAKLADSCHHLGGVAAQPIYPDDDDGVADLARRLGKVSRPAK